jgi:hypothetical protein
MIDQMFQSLDLFFNHAPSLFNVLQVHQEVADRLYSSVRSVALGQSRLAHPEIGKLGLVSPETSKAETLPMEHRKSAGT